MQTGAPGKHPTAGINVTPLIDVLLVLLIIFMVIQPVILRGLPSAVPRPANGSSGSALMLTVTQSNGRVQYALNGTELPAPGLVDTLRAVLSRSSDRTLFVKGDGKLDYAAIATAVDAGHAAGADTVSLVTERASPGL